MSLLEEIKSRPKDFVGIASGIIGIFVFVTGVQSLPHLIGIGRAPGTTPNPVFHAGISSALKWFLFLFVITALYLGIFKMCVYVRYRFFRNAYLELLGLKGLFSLLIPMLLIFGVHLVIFESFFGSLGAILEGRSAAALVFGMGASLVVAAMAVVIGFEIDVR